METSGPTSGVPKAVATSNPTSSVTQWQVGQLLQATVTRSDIGKVLLSIGNRQLSAQTSLPLQNGQQLALQVRSLGEQPLLRIMTNLSAPSPVADAVRMLLPVHAALTPVLASLGQLAKSTDSPLPAPIRELVRNILKQLPDTASSATRAGLKQALHSSGIFLESRLAQAARTGGANPGIQFDFKANLLRLVQALRDWPGNQQQNSGAIKPQPAPPQPPAANSFQRTTPTVSAAGGASQSPGVAQTPASGPNPASGTASPEQLRRAISNATAATLPAAKSASPPAPNTTAGLSQGKASATTPFPPTTASLAPPFRGSVPLPQAAAESTLDLMNRLGNFRLDLLQQAEAAVARIQLHQLAALPREAERGLLEWLFELPIRRGDELDLWAMRLYREPGAQAQKTERKPANWCMQLAFELPGLGPVQALVQLTGETVSTRFWAEDMHTVPLFNQHLDELRRALLDAGLDVADLDCLPGCIQPDKAAPDENFINEKA